MFNWFKKKDKNKTSPSQNGPDFSNVNSNEKAIGLYNKGELVKVHLMPLEFGGEDSPRNTLYAPEFAQQFKQRFDAMIENLLHEGKNLSYNVQPSYKGKSFIPSVLTIKVTGDADFTETINVW
ncbi:hypothetical protein [uncultured Kordia sp.]|uniref:hypothetical protein n=1 Tax=uncultured Kordia sp. TaxID=507699 RepID=UPI002637226A|nr:hypothetical protein [uncultured Kordia sp.]